MGQLILVLYIDMICTFIDIVVLVLASMRRMMKYSIFFRLLRGCKINFEQNDCYGMLKPHIL